MTVTWHALEEDKSFVLSALKKGNIGHVEVVGAVKETELFRLLLDEQILTRLAAEYPTPRKKEEVPLWLYLASQMSLRLHGANGFGGYPYILHCGGLLDALGPPQVQYRRDDSGKRKVVLQGYNEKNRYARATPCDKDFLRKLAKDTSPKALEYWFGTSVVQEYQRLGAFDREGLFAIDGTYIFVPLNNDRYEHSSRLRFNDRGHPIGQKEYEALPKWRQECCIYRRCYRAVTLSHFTRTKEYSLRCGTTISPGKASETPKVWPIVSRFLSAVGVGVMKLLVFDRGLIDGKTIGRLKRRGVDSLFPLKKGMNLWEDAKVLARHDGKPWQRYDIPQPEAPPPPPNRPEDIVRREAARQKTLREKQEQQERENGPTEPPRVLQFIQYKWIEPSTVWDSCDVPVSVLLLNNHYANGDTLDWALASTKVFDNPLDMWTTYNLRPVVEEDHRQEKCFWNLGKSGSTAFSMVVNRILFVELTYSLIQILLRKIERKELVGRTRQRLLESLLPNEHKIAVYYQQRFGQFTLYEILEHTLMLKEGVRRKLIGTIRRLRRAQLTPPELPWRNP